MVDTLTDLSEAELLEEIRAREASAGRAAVAPAQRNPALSGIDDATLVKAARDGQKVIYGVDNRIEAFQVPAGADRDDLDSVVALFDVADVVDNGNGTSTLQTQNFGTSRNLCSSEPFRDQPIGAFCSGFLVGPDLVATAGHCANTTNVTDISFVFGYRMLDTSNAETVINNARNISRDLDRRPAGDRKRRRLGTGPYRSPGEQPPDRCNPPRRQGPEWAGRCMSLGIRLACR